MKLYPILTASLLSLGSASAVSVSIEDLAPAGDGTNNLTTSTGTISISSPAAGFGNARQSNVATGTYIVSISDLTAGALTDVVLNFDLTLAATDADRGIVENGIAWTVDRFTVGTANDQEGARISANEGFTFSVDNVSATSVSSPAPLTATFTSFDDLDIGVFGGAGFTATFDTSTGTVTGSGAAGTASLNGSRVNNLDLSFDVTPVPEPSTGLLMGFAIAPLLLRRTRS